MFGGKGTLFLAPLEKEVSVAPPPPTCHRKQPILAIRNRRNRRHVADFWALGSVSSTVPELLPSGERRHRIVRRPSRGKSLIGALCPNSRVNPRVKTIMGPGLSYTGEAQLPVAYFGSAWPSSHGLAPRLFLACGFTLSVPAGADCRGQPHQWKGMCPSRDIHHDAVLGISLPPPSHS